jgi:hypothetical protein
MHGMDDDEENGWELRRPDLLLQAIAEQHPFDRPRTLLARVDGPYEAQRLTGTTLLWQEPAVDELERTRLTEQALERLGFTRTAGGYRSWPLAVPVVVRPGSTLSSWDEHEAFVGLRYGSNWVGVRQGDILTVTARGWSSWLDGIWGTTPRAQWSRCRAA